MGEEAVGLIFTSLKAEATRFACRAVPGDMLWFRAYVAYDSFIFEDETKACCRFSIVGERTRRSRAERNRVGSGAAGTNARSRRQNARRGTVESSHLFESLLWTSQVRFKPLLMSIS